MLLALFSCSCLLQDEINNLAGFVFCGFPEEAFTQHPLEIGGYGFSSWVFLSEVVFRFCLFLDLCFHSVACSARNLQGNHLKSKM
uniref:Uncharacterized protein n=1 Tax=Rhizophora mucronata TaxID=61149 RepID=A0A2P2IJ40_RHIMU